MTTSDSTHTDGPTLLTYVVLFYNQEAFATQAVRSALAQSYSPLEIVFSDDASSDESFDLVQRMVEEYDGPHRVILNRNEKNLGVAGNLNRAMELATGEIVVFTGGDDISMPHRAARAAEVLDAESDCLCVSFGVIRFEGTDIPVEPESHPEVTCTRYTMSDYVADPFFHLSGNRAFRRQAFDFFGPIATECPTEDSVMLLRCFLLGDALATPEPQLHYRRHRDALSHPANIYRMDPAAIHRQYLRDIAVAVEHGLLSDDELEQLRSTLELRLKRRTLQRDYHFASNRLGMFFRIIAISKAFSGREMQRMLRTALKPRKRY